MAFDDLQRTEPRDQMQSANLDITLIDPLSGSGWDDLLSTHPDTTIFHTSAWARVLARTYGHQPFYLHFTRSGRSAALLPLMEVASRFTGSRGVCLPFSDFCAPLLFGDAEAMLYWRNSSNWLSNENGTTSSSAAAFARRRAMVRQELSTATRSIFPAAKKHFLRASTAAFIAPFGRQREAA